MPAAKYRLGFALLLLMLVSNATAQHKILFIGNSYTFGRNHNETVEESVPEIFTALATAGGHTTPIVSMRAVSGKDFEYHYNNSQDQIGAEEWTHVILQNQSTQPTHIGDINAHMEWGQRLYESIIANHPGTQVMLYMTWARQASHSIITGTSTNTTFESTDEMLEELVTNYTMLAERINLDHPDSTPVTVNPVGIAFQSAGANLPSSDPQYLDMFSDGTHANDLGYYLSACVHYSCIYQSSPVGLFDSPSVSALGLSITDQQAAFLEQVAWDTVSPEEGIDTDPPTLIEVNPDSDQSLELYFSEPLDEDSSLDPDHFTVINRGKNIGIDSFEISSSAQSVRIHLESKLLGNYALIVDTGITDVAGNSLDEETLYLGNRSVQSILIDVGSSYTVTDSNDTWNQLTGITSTIREQVDSGTPYVFVSDLIDSADQSTGIELSMTDNMLSTNSAGTDSGPYPAGATRDSFFGLTGTFGGYTEDGQGVFEFNNCDPDRSYTFRIFTSRIGDTENRETRYTLTGSSSTTGDLVVSQNINEVLELGPISPTAGGKITLTVSAGPNNDHSLQFYYLGLIEIQVGEGDTQPIYPPVASKFGLFLDWTVDGELEFCSNLADDWAPFDPSPSAPYFDTDEFDKRFYRIDLDP